MNLLRKAEGNFVFAKDDLEQRKIYCECLFAFFEWYIGYCTLILKDKKYNEKEICEGIFTSSINSEQEFKFYLLANIQISKEYVEYLKNKILEDNIKVYNSTIMSLTTDLEWLIANVEINIKKSVTSLSLNSSRRPNLTPKEIFLAANTMFRIEEVKNISDLYLRDIKPIVMFQIRQLLEVYGRNIIGYFEITDTKGNLIKKFTQIAWEFIKDEVKKDNSRIKLPFHLPSILHINNWSNSFVHTTYLYSSYIQFYALNVLHVLFKPSETPIVAYSGNAYTSFCYGPIKITEYNSLKMDFESYLKKRNKDIEIKVVWMETKNVNAYIISL